MTNRSSYPVMTKPTRTAPAPLRLVRVSRTGNSPAGDPNRFAGPVRTLKIPVSAKRP